MPDTIEQINCPACGKLMHKILMKDAQCMLDVCIDGCGGIFFDNQELKRFDEHNESIEEITKAIEGKTFEKTDDTLTRLCPVCGNKMVKNHASAKHEVLIDECYNCGAKFLDHSELNKIRNQYATEEDRRQDFLSSTYNEIGSVIDNLEYQNNINQMHRSVFLRALDHLLFYKHF